MTSTEQIAKNCHFISRFLTKPWEDHDRHLWFYDFEQNAFDLKSSKNLFAVARLNEPHVETWLARMVEDPLAKIRPRLVAADPTALDDWRFYRAAVLMLWLQGARSRTINDQDARRNLEQLATLPDVEIDALVALLRAEFDMQLVFTVAPDRQLAPLFVPSTGVFPLLVNDGACLSGYAVALGLPLDLHCALVATPHNSGGLADLSRMPSSIANYSIGPAGAKHVVIAQPVQGSMPDNDLAKHLQELRDTMTPMFEAVAEVKELVVDAFGIAGITLETDGAGRLRKPPI